MKISAKGHYAVKAMLDLAKQPPNTPIPLSNISVRQDISLNFLEQLFVKLRRGKIVKSVRGPGGGYLLAKKSCEISIGLILRTVGEDFSVSACMAHGGTGSKDCKKSEECAVSNLWQRLSDHIYQVIDGIHLESLVKGEGKASKKKGVPHNYQINI